MQTNVYKLLNKKQYIQRTLEWHQIRYNILTASSIASALDANPYLSKLDMLLQRCKPFDLNNINKNLATEWGIKYEPVATQIYESLKKEKVHQVGLYIHDIYNWLGASPDGLRDSGKLVEIKCVFRRKITDDIPLYYWMQVQIQLEVCDLEECDLFQCKFVEYQNKSDFNSDIFALKKDILKYDGKTYYWKLEKYSLNTIFRDKKWFNKVKPLLYQFWKDIMHYREVGINKIKIKNYDDINIQSQETRKSERISKKRKVLDMTLENEKNNNFNIKLNVNKLSINNLSVNNNLSANKKHKYIREDWTQWINATETKNYMMKDPLLDWLNIYGDHEHHKYQKDSNNNFNEYMTSKEKEFHCAVVKNLYKRFPEKIITIAHINEKFSIDKYQETVNAMINGVPIILKGLLHNRSNNTYGFPDIILRKDYLPLVILNSPQQETFNTHIGYDYCVLSIKYMSLKLKNNLIVNVGNIISYKSELIIYNEALKSILGYVPNHAYIIGRKYKSATVYGPFENIGMIDVVGYDHNIVTKTYEALNWLKEIKKYGNKWSINNPHRWELYPNMSNSFDYPWHQLKKKLAIDIGEITTLWNCGIKERNIAHMNGVYSLDNITTDLIGFKGKKQIILNNFLKINSSSCLDIIIHDKITQLNTDKLEFYVDFETVNSLDLDFTDIIQFDFNKKHNLNHHGMIYMIGIGYKDHHNKWCFKCFTVDRLNHQCEKEILLQWLNYMDIIKEKYGIQKKKNCRVYHWSKAEVSESNKAFKRHNIQNISINWYDLLDYFKNNHIAIKGVYNYGLKSVAKALYKHKLIKTKWSDDSLDGTSAMLAAWNCEIKCLNNEGSQLKDFKEMQEIIKYNRVDCKVMLDILKVISNY